MTKKEKVELVARAIHSELFRFQDYDTSNPRPYPIQNKLHNIRNNSWKSQKEIDAWLVRCKREHTQAQRRLNQFLKRVTVIVAKLEKQGVIK